MKIQTTEIDQQIGARVREFRLLRSMSQEALAERLGITFQQLQKYEKGMNRVSVSVSVSASALMLICKELGITPYVQLTTSSSTLSATRIPLRPIPHFPPTSLR
ncbi:helix-turn-helix domain-containing protein [Sinorhizobium meliloti]|uniref:helix-turn-helix domain-containing protein n=1 Tax=Rhizobium meliloti TaxID=382 RepID=UPI000FD2BA8D|nr:helix-turn-helix transcriptional regulator [Sinorhizobium meliloti]RVJ69208.1 XRE family transcriptional regulator [Sinorhizobium meliloti]